MTTAPRATDQGQRRDPSDEPAAPGRRPTTADSAADLSPLRPGVFCQYQLRALEAAEGQTRRRKRDQEPDRIGLGVKRELLERTIAADPAPEAFEGWLMEQMARAQHPGSVRAMCEQLYLEYRAVRMRPELAAWLEAGAPSDDAERDGARPRRRDREWTDGAPPADRWHGPDDPLIACTCHLPQR